MLLDIFTRIFYFLSSSFTPAPIDLNTFDNPSNLTLTRFTQSFGDWLNDTVIIDNPFFQYERDYEEDGSTFYEPITLPLCCGSIDPTGNGTEDRSSQFHYCSEEDDDHGNGGVQVDYEQIDIISGRRHTRKSYWSPTEHFFPSENRSHYRFVVRKPTCSNVLKHVKISLDDFEVGKQGRFLRNGYFGYDNEEFYSPHEYCISGLTGEFVQVMICDSDCSSERVCLSKCCNPDEIYSFTRRECIKSKTMFSPIFYNDLSNKLSETQQEKIHPHFFISYPRSFKYECVENRTQIIPARMLAHYLSNITNQKYYSAHFKIRNDGKIMYRKDGKAKVLPEGYPIYLQDNSKKCYTLKTSARYCIDGAAEYGSPNPFNNDEGEIFFVTCSEYLFEPPKIGPLSFVYGNVMITSSLFSFLTAVVYMLLKEKRNIHGWTIASYAFSVFLMYIFLGLAHLIRYYKSDDVLKTKSCVTIGIASHLFSLSSFLWLTLMNWDIWWTFRKFRPSTRANKRGLLWRGKEFRHFLTYSMFGWGVPIFITGISTSLHFKYETASEDDCAVVGVPLPAYGRESCEIKQLSLGVYLYFPAAVLLACNLLFFIVTTYRLCRHSRQTQLATKNLERHHQSVQLFAKLFFVMGVTRVFEVITWVGSGPTLTWYWAVFDIFNVLQAVAIFIIYVCKRDVLDSLKNFFRRFHLHGQTRKGRDPEAWKTTTTSRSSSHISTRGTALFSSASIDASVAVPLLTTIKASTAPLRENKEEKGHHQQG